MLRIHWLSRTLPALATCALVLAAAPTVSASEPSGGAQDPLVTEPGARGYVSGNVFVYFESAEGDLSGSTGGGGATFGFFFRPKWTFGAEVAVPGFISGGEGESAYEHRDISVAALLAWHPAMGSTTDVRLLIGLAYLRIQNRYQFGELSSNRGAAVVGIDWRVHVGDTFALVPQARAHVTTGAFVFRAGVGFELGF